ncbi:MAG TPA: cation diffusion facilitator family transporter, partial [Candidatus Dormibacteraeota bacterium]|nr:cation diffusion facilitator family transporter [Candidatus Dormibacteraeota bacterium]
WAKLGAATALTLLIVVVEATASAFAHSVALLADAGHVAVDVLALGFAWLAAWQAGRAPTQRRTYGFHRVGILVGLANAVVLLGIVGGVAALAAVRLEHPARPQGLLMIGAALVGLGLNVVVLRWLRHDPSLNARAALLHVVGDLGAGVAVILAGAVVLLTGWGPADPLLSLLIAVLIAAGAVRLIREVVGVLLEGVPAAVRLGDVESEILGTAGVLAVHDLHVWALTPERRALSCHLTLADQRLSQAEHLVQALADRLCTRFALRHTTIQVESCHPCRPGLCAEDGVAIHNHPHEPAEVAAPGPAR